MGGHILILGFGGKKNMKAGGTEACVFWPNHAAEFFRPKKKKEEEKSKSKAANNEAPKSAIKACVISTDMANGPCTAGIHVRNARRAHAEGPSRTDPPLFFHEINIFRAAINLGVLRACMLSATGASSDSLLTHGERGRWGGGQI